MRDWVGGFILALLGFSLTGQPVLALSTFNLYRDGNYSEESTTFSPGSTFYIRAELSFTPNLEARAVLKKADGSEVGSVALGVSGQTASGGLVLPDESGSYLVEVSFKSSESSYLGTRLIKAGEGGNDQSLEINIKNVLNIRMTPVPTRKLSFPLVGEGGYYPGGSQRPIPEAGFTPVPTIVQSPRPSAQLSPSPAPIRVASPEPTGSPSPQPQERLSWLQRIEKLVRGWLNQIGAFLRSLGLA